METLCDMHPIPYDYLPICLSGEIFSVIIFVVTGFLPGSSIVSLAARSPSLAFPLFKDEDALVGGIRFRNSFHNERCRSDLSGGQACW